MATELTIQERLISAPIVNEGSGIVAYAVYSERGNPIGFLDIESVKDLEDTIGLPTTDTISDFLVCYDFLQYGNTLKLKRIVPSDAELARSGFLSDGTERKIGDTGIETYFDDYHEHMDEINQSLEFWTKEPYDTSNSNNPVYKVYCAKYTGNDWAGDADSDNEGTGQVLNIGDTGYDFSDLFEVGPKEQSDTGVDINEIAVVLTENDIIIETHMVSTVSGSRNAQGKNYFISDWLDRYSNYIWGFCIADEYDSLPDIADGESIMECTLGGGSKGSVPTQAEVLSAYNEFNSKDNVDFDYIISGFHENLRDDIQTICGDRKDCIAFLAPNASSFFSGVGSSYYPSANMFPIRNNDTIIENLISDVQSIITGGDETKSRALYYGQWKQIYNPYQDDYRWIPIDASVAGAKVVLNNNANVWTPLAGDNGGLRNVEKLAWEPSPANRKKIYKYKINDAFTDKSLGVIINGTKTLIDKNVGVSRLNGRETLRLIENYAAENSKGFFHKFNNATTRARWIGVHEPFMDSILNRAIERYELVCDDSNNTSLVINNNEFVAYIFVETYRPIEKILITVIDTPNGVSFDEIIV